MTDNISRREASAVAALAGAQALNGVASECGVILTTKQSKDLMRGANVSTCLVADSRKPRPSIRDLLKASKSRRVKPAGKTQRVC